MEGLLESQLYDIAKATLENFMDELDLFGFIPNGGRIYCKEYMLSKAPSNLPQIWTDLNLLCSSR